MDLEEKTRLLKQYDVRICWFVRKLVPYSSIRQDLYQVARQAFVKSLDTFDANFGCTHWTYARYHIMHDVFLYLVKNKSLMRNAKQEPEFIIADMQSFDSWKQELEDLEFMQYRLSYVKSKIKELPLWMQKYAIDLCEGKEPKSRQVKSLVIKALRKKCNKYDLE